MEASCKNCQSAIKPFFSLGKMPLVNSFLKKPADFRGEKKFDLTVGFCPKCFLVQLTKTVPPEEMFRNYIYFSSTSSFFLKHCLEIADNFVKRFSLGPQSLILEIASNDGSLLGFFKEKGIGVLGVDPAENIARVANNKGIETIPEFFNNNFVKNLKRERGISADLVFGANVLAHVPEIKNLGCSR